MRNESFIYRHKSCVFDHRIERRAFLLQKTRKYARQSMVHLQYILLMGNLMILINNTYLYSVLLSFHFFQLAIILFQKKKSFSENQMNSKLTYCCFDFKLFQIRNLKYTKSKSSTHKE